MVQSDINDLKTLLDLTFEDENCFPTVVVNKILASCKSIEDFYDKRKYWAYLFRLNDFEIEKCLKMCIFYQMTLATCSEYEMICKSARQCSNLKLFYNFALKRNANENYELIKNMTEERRRTVYKIAYFVSLIKKGDLVILTSNGTKQMAVYTG